MRALRVLVVVLVVLCGVFVAVDRAAVYFAESEAADRVRIAGGDAESTDVSIKGFPFLTQVADRRLDRVDVSLSGISAASGGRTVRISGLDARLEDVTLGEGYSSATAGRLSGTAAVSYADLTTAVGDEAVSVAYGGDGKVKVTGSVSLLGRSFSRSVTSTVTLIDGRTVRVHADKVPGEGIPGLEDLVRTKTDFERELSGLPDGLELSKIEVAENGLRISVRGTGFALTG
ncbi:DUF2993 domain-containing protein [uncultured Streptomyces sp.]|uniref:LmeA family phospholipid-binding protein n=1 Tax=uncultured Streptomyces sp. TaxID=174707 RepID=UPI0026078951|nr:DUF2993 domain-containing protein [uncultured Streptomyces sp.]